MSGAESAAAADLHRESRARPGVVFAVAGVDAGGCERRFANLFKHLASLPEDRLPWEVTFVVDAAMAARVPAFAVHPVSPRVRLVPAGIAAGRGRLGRAAKTVVRWVNLAAGAAAFRRVMRSRPDALVHFTNPFSMRWWPFVGHRPVVISFVAAGRPEQKLRLHSFRRLLRAGARADCLSADLAERLRAFPGNAGVRTFTSPGSFVDATGYEASATKGRVVTFAGRLQEQKGVRLLIEALPGILALDPEVKVRVLGRGELEEELRDAVAALPERGRVEMGWVVDLAPALLESTVFLSLQTRENYPSQSLLEAMLARNAVVATDVGLTHLLVDETTGFRVRTAEEVVDAVGRLLADDALRAACGEAARRRVLEEHSVEGFVAYLEEVYEDARRGVAGGTA